MNKRILLILMLASLAGVVYFGMQLSKNGAATAAKTPEQEPLQQPLPGLRLLVHKDTLALQENGRQQIAVLFDSAGIKPGFFGIFDTLLSRTDLYSKSQLNYSKNKTLQLRTITDEKQSITEFLKEAGMSRIADSLPLRQLLFRVVLDTVRRAEAAGKAAVINDNKELAHTLLPALPVTPETGSDGKKTAALTPLLICAGIVSLLALAALFFNNNNTMAKARKKKNSESEEDYLKLMVYQTLGKDTAEARYFTEVLSNHKRYQEVKEQLKPEGKKPDTGTLINNMKDAGLLTAGESRTLFELHELKEKITAVKTEGATNTDKQQHLMQLLGGLTKDEGLKAHLELSAGEGKQWQQLMNLDEAALPGALQNVIRFYDEKYGNGRHRLSPVYAETLRRAQLDIPENFSAEDRFLKALYEQYRGLLDDVLYTWFSQQHSEEKVAEARQTFVNRLAQLAFHAHSFLTHYNKDVAALPPATTQVNMQLVSEKGTVAATAGKNNYRTYSRDITRFEREMFLQKLLTGIGVNNLENVLLKDVYYSKEGLEG